MCNIYFEVGEGEGKEGEKGEEGEEGEEGDKGKKGRKGRKEKGSDVVAEYFFLFWFIPVVY